MHPLKSIIKFFLIVVVVYVLLIVRWPGVRDAYRGAYIWAAHSLVTVPNVVFGRDRYLQQGTERISRFGGDGLYRLTPHADDGKTDVTVTIGHRKIEGGLQVSVHSGQLGYAPTTLLIALVVATPIRWKRRGWALVCGFGLVQVFVLLRIWLLLTHAFSQQIPFRLYEPGPFWRAVLDWLYEMVIVSPTCTFLVPALIWVLATIRREDLARVAEGVRSLTCVSDAGS